MPITRIVVNRAGVRALLTGPEIRADLTARARRVALTAGPGMKVETNTGHERARAAVITDTVRARIAEATRRTLTRAIDAAR